MNKFEALYGTKAGQEEFYAHPEKQQDIIDNAKEETEIGREKRGDYGKSKTILGRVL